MRMADIMAFTILPTKDLSQRGEMRQRQGFKRLLLNHLLGNVGLYTAHCLIFSPKVSPELVWKKKIVIMQATFSQVVVCSESRFLEGGKVIRCLGLERPFHLRSSWAGINKDGTDVNNDLTREGGRVRGNLKGRTLSPPHSDQSPPCFKSLNPWILIRMIKPDSRR